MANAHIQLSFNKPVLDVPKASFILEAKLRQYSFDIGFGGGCCSMITFKKLISEFSHLNQLTKNIEIIKDRYLKTITSYGCVKLVRFFLIGRKMH